MLGNTLVQIKEHRTYGLRGRLLSIYTFQCVTVLVRIKNT